MRDGQRDHEPRPAHARLQADLAVMVAYDRLAHGQSHTGSLARILPPRHYRELAAMVRLAPHRPPAV